MVNKNGHLEAANVSSASGGPLPLSNQEQRRRFIKGGLAGGGVVMSLASRQVLAQTGVCTTASGFTSLAASGPRTSQFVCDGRTPGYWGQPQKVWPAPYTKGNLIDGGNNTWDAAGTKFNATFGRPYKYPNNPSMMQVIWLGGGGDPY